MTKTNESNPKYEGKKQSRDRLGFIYIYRSVNAVVCVTREDDPARTHRDR